MELLDKILSKENLNQAYKKVYQNKGACGVDGITIEELLGYLKENGNGIIEKIKARKYKPQPVKRVEIPKGNGKMRKLGIPVVVDRVIQQAIAQILTPIYEEQFNDCSFGFRPNRSCEMAVIKALEFMNNEYTWIVDINLERFFDTVNHDRLLNIISRTIDDGDVISLIRKYLESGVMIKGKLEKSKIGTPQGGNLSPLLSNIMLNELDKELEARGLKFVRYADDSMIFAKSEKAANRILKSVTIFIEKKLGLKVNAEKSKISRPRTTKFLGFGFWVAKDGVIKSKPHLKSIQKFKRKLKELTTRKWSISLNERIKKINQVVRGWVNYFRIASMKNVLIKIDERLRTRIRVIIWKQWKKTKKRCQSLIQLGVDKEIGFNCANTRKGYQQICKSRYVMFAINNERLRKRGLICGLDQYEKVYTEI